MGAPERQSFAAQFGWQTPPLQLFGIAQSEGTAHELRHIPVAELQL